jgi:hypothetical protein
MPSRQRRRDLVEINPCPAIGQILQIIAHLWFASFCDISAALARLGIRIAECPTPRTHGHPRTSVGNPTRRAFRGRGEMSPRRVFPTEVVCFPFPRRFAQTSRSNAFGACNRPWARSFPALRRYNGNQSRRITCALAKRRNCYGISFATCVRRTPLRCFLLRPPCAWPDGRSEVLR